MTLPALITVQNGAQVFVYENTPGPMTLVASHCPGGAAPDLFGNPCPAGDWCADGYEIIPMIEVWPGALLRACPPKEPA